MREPFAARAFGNGGITTSPDPEHDIFVALERWVEQGVAPDRIVGAGTAVEDPSKTLTRPLCVYPKVARYQGSGDPNSAASFACVTPAASR